MRDIRYAIINFDKTMFINYHGKQQNISQITNHCSWSRIEDNVNNSFYNITPDCVFTFHEFCNHTFEFDYPKYNVIKFKRNSRFSDRNPWIIYSWLSEDTMINSYQTFSFDEKIKTICQLKSFLKQHISFRYNNIIIDLVKSWFDMPELLLAAKLK